MEIMAIREIMEARKRSVRVLICGAGTLLAGCSTRSAVAPSQAPPERAPTATPACDASGSYLVGDGWSAEVPFPAKLTISDVPGVREKELIVELGPERTPLGRCFVHQEYPPSIEKLLVEPFMPWDTSGTWSSGTIVEELAGGPLLSTTVFHSRDYSPGEEHVEGASSRELIVSLTPERLAFCVSSETGSGSEFQERARALLGSMKWFQLRPSPVWASVFSVARFDDYLDDVAVLGFSWDRRFQSVDGNESLDTRMTLEMDGLRIIERHDLERSTANGELLAAATWDSILSEGDPKKSVLRTTDGDYVSPLNKRLRLLNTSGTLKSHRDLENRLKEKLKSQEAFDLSVELYEPGGVQSRASSYRVFRSPTDEPGIVHIEGKDLRGKALVDPSGHYEFYEHKKAGNEFVLRRVPRPSAPVLSESTSSNYCRVRPEKVARKNLTAPTEAKRPGTERTPFDFQRGECIAVGKVDPSYGVPPAAGAGYPHRISKAIFRSKDRMLSQHERFWLLPPLEELRYDNGYVNGQGHGLDRAGSSRFRKVQRNGSELTYFLSPETMVNGRELLLHAKISPRDPPHNFSLQLLGDVELKAKEGSSEGRIELLALVATNGPRSGRDQNFHYALAPLCSLVPVTIDVHLKGRQRFTKELFESTFAYEMEAEVDFTQATF
jgi:hypothetical protein